MVLIPVVPVRAVLKQSAEFDCVDSLVCMHGAEIQIRKAQGSASHQRQNKRRPLPPHCTALPYTSTSI